MNFKKLFQEETSSGDIAVFTGKLGDKKKQKTPMHKKCASDNSDDCIKTLKESPVGSVGRTGASDAKAHVNAKLRAEFKKIVKALGGKTVARQLLAEMNAGGAIDESEFKNKQKLRTAQADKVAKGFNFTWDKSDDTWVSDDDYYTMEFDSKKQILYSNVPSMGISNAINTSM